MPEVTIQDVVTTARNKIGDNTSTTAGQVYSDTELLSYINSALMEVNQICRVVTNPWTRREIFAYVPTNTSFVLWDHNNQLSDAALLQGIWYRGVDSVFSIASVNVSAPPGIIVECGSNHGLVVGDSFQIVGSDQKWLNGIYSVTGVPGATQLTTTPVYIPVGAATTTVGNVIVSNGDWNPVTVGQGVIFDNATINDIPRVSWEDHGIRFSPVLGPKIIRVFALLGPQDAAALTDKLVYAEAKEALALKIALIAMGAKGGSLDTIEFLRTELYGQGGNAGDVKGGAMMILRRSLILQAQNIRQIRPRFRPFRVPYSPGFARF